MRKLLPMLGILLGIAALLAAPLAQAQAEVNLRIDRVDDSAFPEVRLFATVTDAQGRARSGLTSDNFVLREGGRSIPLISATTVPSDMIELRVVLALDISKSIEPGLDQIRAAATDFIRSLTPGDQVALVVFGNSARIAQPFTADHGAVINNILSIGPAQLEDYTALYNGTFESVRLAADGATNGRRVVVVLTDGNNTTPPGSDSLDLTDVQRGASERRVPVHVIAVGSKLSDQELRIIATDGRFLRVDQPNQLSDAYNDIAGQLRQQYLLSYTSQLPADGGTYPLDLGVNVPDMGTAQTTANVRSIPPARPYPRVSFPEQIVAGQSVKLEVEVLSRSAPALGEILLDGESVLSETLSSAVWAPSWTPSRSLSAGPHQLKVRVSDAQGEVGITAAQTVMILAAAPSPVAGGSGIPLWIWMASGVMVTLLIGGGIALLLRRRQEPPSDLPPWPPPGQSQVPPVGPQLASVAATGGSVHTLAQKSPEPTQLDRPGLVNPNRASLVVTRGEATPTQFTLKASKDVLIGRQPDADIVVGDKLASTQHARIRFLENGFTIADLNSTNGLWVNGRRVDRVRLQDNDQIVIAGVTLVFKQVRGKG